ncbi:protocatechuate 3,4-dioxygenase alpha subunit [Sinosporangium album]|uniref:Protocatechuate 3,4-dioxygenase alpha subunit n=1 Tax=Sinosporangium album TaxID=504805 RepID=A0A1G8HVC7_9ACTN|nr:protocatechuate 3,4-dioxygenase subunit alpha [Sinosporangium album]SDI10430.1 protocatechuate 3,4-dioxygenase alpha subunit [Sinosporangium album]
MKPTPSQTIGPFYGYALPFAGGGDIRGGDIRGGDIRGGDIARGGITVHGHVYDGAGAPVSDALLEFWQADPSGGLRGAPGTLRRDPVTGAIIGRDGVAFTGFGRTPTDADGHWTLRTHTPGNGYISVCLFARGLLHHLYTRVYLGAEPSGPLADALTPERRRALAAVEEREGVYRFDIHMQGEKETVFLDFA